MLAKLKNRIFFIMLFTVLIGVKIIYAAKDPPVNDCTLRYNYDCVQQSIIPDMEYWGCLSVPPSWTKYCASY